MSLLSEFEDRVAGAVEGLFAGAFRSPVQPAEIAKALARAMDDARAVGVGKVYVPVAYTVALSAEDTDQMGSFAGTLAGELSTFLLGHARERQYHLASKPDVSFTVHDSLKLGRFRVSATRVSPPSTAPVEQPERTTSIPVRGEAPVTGDPTVTVGDLQPGITLRGERIVVGRLDSSEITLTDANVSREHAAFEREGAGWAIVDLDSTNGTSLNGTPVSRQRLVDGDVVQVGATQLVYHEPRG